MNQLSTSLATRKIIADDDGVKKVFYVDEKEFAGIYEDVKKRSMHVWIKGETFKYSQLKFKKIDSYERNKISNENNIVYIKDSFLDRTKEGIAYFLMQEMRIYPDKTEKEINRYIKIQNIKGVAKSIEIKDLHLYADKQISDHIINIINSK